MFIRLTTKNKDIVYYNTEYIRCFHRKNEYTVLDLQYGTQLVEETPEEIIVMLKGD